MSVTNEAARLVCILSLWIGDCLSMHMSLQIVHLKGAV
jgi:hypothetical protein